MSRNCAAINNAERILSSLSVWSSVWNSALWELNQSHVDAYLSRKSMLCYLFSSLKYLIILSYQNTHFLIICQASTSFLRWNIFRTLMLYNLISTSLTLNRWVLILNCCYSIIFLTAAKPLLIFWAPCGMISVTLTCCIHNYCFMMALL